MIFFGILKIIIGIMAAILAFPLLSTLGPAALVINVCAGITIGNGLTDILS